jgi:hypothetical protein
MKEWELRVSQRELQRMHVVRLTLEGGQTVGSGAKLLGISVRQVKRLRRKMKERGVEGLTHGFKKSWGRGTSDVPGDPKVYYALTCGRPASNSLSRCTPGS